VVSYTLGILFVLLFYLLYILVYSLLKGFFVGENITTMVCTCQVKR